MLNQWAKQLKENEQTNENYVMPDPSANESRSDFIARCMNDALMKDEFPRLDQRMAVCQMQWQQ